MGGTASKSHAPESDAYKTASAALGSDDMAANVAKFEALCVSGGGQQPPDSLSLEATVLRSAFFPSVSGEAIANLVASVEKKLHEDAPPLPPDAPSPSRSTSMTKYGYAVLAAAFSKLGPLDKFKFYFGLVVDGSGSNCTTPEVLEALLTDVAAFAFAQPGVTMPPKPVTLEEEEFGDEEDDDDDEDGEGGGGGRSGAAAAALAAKAKLKEEVAAAAAVAAAEAAAEVAAALASIEIPKATAEEQVRLVRSLVKMAFRLPGRKGFLGESKPTLDKEGFITFLEHYSVAEAMMDKVFVEGMGYPNPRAGNHLGHELVPALSRLLSPCDVAMLYYAVPDEIRDDWSLCFSSERDGGSFASLRRELLETGSTLLVVKDKDGHVFGGFALEHWKQKPEFYGSEGCFLFSLQPEMAVHRPSNLNQNFMYSNWGMETLPNGLGMGGQFNYFGLFIDASFDKGHCNAQPLSTTYNSPMLSKSTEFLVDEVEVWRIGPKPKSKIKRKGILEGNATEQALLEMAGKKLHSKDIRIGFDSEEGVFDPKTGKVKRPVY